MAETHSQEQLDITGADAVEVRIRADGTVLWVNTPEGCVLRICRIKPNAIVIEDDRLSDWRAGLEARRELERGHSGDAD